MERNATEATGRLTFTLTGKITPKQRPRFGGGRAYLPEAYREWKNSAIIELMGQLKPCQPVECAQVSIELHGSQRGDLDNLSGSILDALVQSEILLDDRLSVLRKLTVEHFSSDWQGAMVIIQPIAPIKKVRKARVVAVK